MKWFLSILAALALGNAGPVVWAAPVAAPIEAPAYFLLDLDSGRVLAEKNAHQRMFPASTTKIMTCLVAMEHGQLDKMIKVSSRAAGTGESGIGLLAGENLTLADLVKAAMIKSANDSCVAIAEGVAGTEAKFVALMNEKAKDLGCKETNFVNPHGLHHPNHTSSARDLAVIARTALKHPFLSEISAQKTALIRGNWKVGAQRVLINRNKLLWRWDACDGLKTGYTRQAGNCLVATATVPDAASGKPWRLLSVVLKTAGGASWPQSQLLLSREGFQAYRRQKMASAGQVLEQRAVNGGAFPLEMAPLRDVMLPLRGEESQTLTHNVEVFDVKAPIEPGRVVGHVEYFASEGGRSRRIADIPLVARSVVPQTMLAKTIPALGNRFPPLAPGVRWLLFGVFSLAFATLLVRSKLNHHGRRKKNHAFEPVRLHSTGDDGGYTHYLEEVSRQDAAPKEPRDSSGSNDPERGGRRSASGERSARRPEAEPGSRYSGIRTEPRGRTGGEGSGGSVGERPRNSRDLDHLRRRPGGGEGGMGTGESRGS